MGETPKNNDPFPNAGTIPAAAWHENLLWPSRLSSLFMICAMLNCVALTVVLHIGPVWLHF